MKINLSRRLILSYTGILIAIIVLSAIAFYQYNIIILLNNGNGNLRQFGQDTMAQVDMQIKNMDIISVELAANFEIIDALAAIETEQNRTDENLQKIKSILIQNYVIKVNIHRISIFTVYGDLFTTGYTDAKEQDVQNAIFQSGWYGDIVVESGRKIFLPPREDVWDRSSGTEVISLIRAIRKDDLIVGYVEVQQKVEIIETICMNEWNGVNLNLAILGEGNSIFYSNIPEEGRDEYLENIIEKTKNNPSSVIETDNELINITNSNYTEYKSYLVLDKDILFESMSLILFYLAIIVVIVVLISGSFIVILTQIMTRPINSFARKISKINLDNLQEPFEYTSKDYETQTLNKSFTDMKDRLISSLNKQKTLESLQTKTLFDILQSEIGPHFLYNSLGSIANMCEAGESKKAAETCYNLSDILRYASNYEKSVVSVSEEVSNLNAYLQLMKSRYRQRLKFNLSIDRNSLDFEIPKLTLQPLAENAIKYSLISNEEVMIKINVILKESVLNITVSDNGCGIDDNKIKDIDTLISDSEKSINNIEIKNKMKFGGMGLIGTLLRLKLFFEDRFKYTIINNPESGMTINIYIENRHTHEAKEFDDV